MAHTLERYVIGAFDYTSAVLPEGATVVAAYIDQNLLVLYADVPDCHASRRLRYFRLLEPPKIVPVGETWRIVASVPDMAEGTMRLLVEEL